MADRNPIFTDPLEGTGLGSFSSNTLLGPEAKQQQIEEASHRKRQALEMKQFKENLQGGYYSNQSRDRTAAELAQDFKVALHGGGNLLATGLYGAANLAGAPITALQEAMTGEHVPSVDEALTQMSGGELGFQALADNRSNYIEEHGSDVLKAALQQEAQADAQWDAQEEARMAEREAAGKGWLRSNIEEIAGDVAHTATQAYENPVATTHAALESIPTMIGAGLVGKMSQGVLQANLAKKASKAAADRFLKTEAGKAAIRKTGEKGAIGFNAALEGLTAGADARLDILNTPVEELREGSPYFQELEAEHGTEVARQKLADKGMYIATAIAATTGGVATKISGAGKLEGNFFNKDSAFGNMFLTRILKGTAVGIKDEAQEEAMQGAGGQFAANVAAKYTKDPDQALGEGVTRATTKGAIIGGLAGGGMAAVTEVPKQAAKSVVDNKGIVQKTKDKIANYKDSKVANEKVKAAVKAKDFREITDDSRDDFNREDAIQALLDPKGLPEEGEAQEEHLNELEYHIEKAHHDAVVAVDKLEEKEDASPEALKEAKKNLALATKKRTRQYRAFQELQGLNEKERVDERLQAAESLITAEKDGNEELAQKSLKVLNRSFYNSPDGLTEKEATALYKSKSASPGMKALAKQRLDILKNIDEVSNDIRKGKGNFIGVDVMRKRAMAAVVQGHQAKAIGRVKDIVDFGGQQVDRHNTMKEGYAAWKKLRGLKSKNTKTAKALKKTVDASIETLSENSGRKFYFSNGTQKIIDQAVNDIAYIDKVAKEAAAAHDHGFSDKYDGPTSISSSVRGQQAQSTDVTDNPEIRELQSKTSKAIIQHGEDKQAIRVEEMGKKGIKNPSDVSVYSKKDAAKASMATQFIGEGGEGTSTKAYQEIYDDKANTGTYEKGDAVFISVNGGNSKTKVNALKDGKLAGVYENIDKAMAAGATLITDTEKHRNRSYNQPGEGAIAKYIQNSPHKYHYKEVTKNGEKVGTWIPVTSYTKAQSKGKTKAWGFHAKRPNELPEGTEGYEVSSKASMAKDNLPITEGDHRFSAFKAKLANGKTIEETYQTTIKGFKTLKEGKGKKPTIAYSEQDSKDLYKALWRQYLNENPTLLDELRANAQGKILTDAYWKKGAVVNQAQTLSELLNEKPKDTEKANKRLPYDLTHIENYSSVLEKAKADENISGKAIQSLETLPNSTAARFFVQKYESLEGDSQGIATQDEHLIKALKDHKKSVKDYSDKTPPTTNDRKLDYLVQIAEKYIPEDPTLTNIKKRMEARDTFTYEDVTALSASLLTKLSKTITQQRRIDAKGKDKIIKDPNFILAKEVLTKRLSSAAKTVHPVQQKDPEGNLYSPEPYEVTAIDNVISTLFDAIDLDPKTTNLLQRHNNFFEALEANPALLDSAELTEADQIAIPVITEFQAKFLEELTQSLKPENPQFMENSPFLYFFGDYSAATKEKLKAQYNLINKIRPKIEETTRPDLAKRIDLTKRLNYLKKNDPKNEEEIASVEKTRAKLNKRITEARQPMTDARAIIDDIIGEQNPNLDANLMSSIAMVALNFIGTGGRKTIKNTEVGINMLLQHKDSKRRVEGAEWQMFGEIGITRSGAVTAMGAEVLKMLGIKFNKDADGRFETLIENHIGGLIVGTLQNMDILRAQTVTAKQMQPFLEHLGETNENQGSTEFIRIYTEDVYRETKEGKFEEFPEPRRDIAEIIEAIRNSDDVLSKLFKLKSKIIKPKKERPKTTELVDGKLKNRKIKRGTDNKESQEQQKIREKHSQQELGFKQTMEIYEWFDPEQAWELAGLVTDYETTEHITEHAGFKGRNDALKRSHENTMEWFREIGPNSTFYATHKTAKNNRVHQEANLIDTQGDTTQKHLVGIKSHLVTVDPKNKAHMNQFLSAVAESLGLSGDKELTHVLKDQLEELFNPAEDATEEAKENAAKLNAGIEAILAFDKDKFANKEANQRAILDAAAVGGENAWSLDGLRAYANYKKADGGKFKTDLFREIDGVTNGVAIGMLELAAAPDFATMKTMLERTGMFMEHEEGEVYKDYGSYIANPRNNDSYKDMGIEWSKQLEEHRKGLKPNQAKWLKGLDSFVNPMTEKNYVDGFYLEQATSIGRTLSKDPVMITNYGAAIKKVVAAFGDKIIRNIYKDIAKAKVDMDQDALDQIHKTLTLIVNNGNTKAYFKDKKPEFTEKDFKWTKVPKYKKKDGKYSTHKKVYNAAAQKRLDAWSKKKQTAQDKMITLPELTVENAINWSLPKGSRDNITKKIGQSYGKALGIAIDSRFATFIAKRQELVEASRIAYEGFKLIYDAELEKQMMLKAKAHNPKAVYGMELSRVELKELAEQLIKFQPIFRPFFATTEDTKKDPLSTNTLDEGILTAKLENKRQINRPPFEVSVKFNKPLVTNIAKEDAKGKITRNKKGHADFFQKSKDSMSLWGSRREFTDGGVSGPILGIHAIDSAVMMSVLKEFEALNIHDAAAFSIHDVMKGTEKLNESFHNVTTNYSLRQSFEDMLLRVTENLKTYDTENGTAFYDQLDAMLITRKSEQKDTAGDRENAANNYMGITFDGWVPLTPHDDITAFKTRRTNVNKDKTWLPAKWVDEKYIIGEDQNRLDAYVENFKATTTQDELFRQEVIKAITHWHQYSSGQGGVFETPNEGYKFNRDLFKTPAERLAEETLTQIKEEAAAEEAEDGLYRLLNSVGRTQTGEIDGRSKRRLWKYAEEKNLTKHLQEILDGNIKGQEAADRQRDHIVKYLASLASEPDYEQFAVAYIVALSNPEEYPDPDSQKEYVKANTRVDPNRKNIIDRLFKNVERKFSRQERFENLFGKVRQADIESDLVSDYTTNDVLAYIEAYVNEGNAKDIAKEKNEKKNKSLVFQGRVADRLVRLVKTAKRKRTFPEALKEIDAWAKKERGVKNPHTPTVNQHSAINVYLGRLRTKFPTLDTDTFTFKEADTKQTTDDLLDQAKDQTIDTAAWVDSIADQINDTDNTAKKKQLNEIHTVAKKIHEDVTERGAKPEEAIKRQLDEGNKKASENALQDYVDFPGKTLGSSSKKVKGKFNDKFTRNLSGANVKTIYEEMGPLGNVIDSTEHDEHLRSIVGDVIAKVIDPIADRQQEHVKLLRRNEGDETFGEVGEDGNVYLVTALGTQHLSTKMSARETYVHELIHVVTKEAVDSDTWAARELKKLYESVRTHTTDGKPTIAPEDFLREGIKKGDNNYAEEMKLAKQRYNYIFGDQIKVNTHTYKDSYDKNQTSRTHNAHHEFLASGLSNAAFKKALKKIDGVTKLIAEEDASILDKLVTFFKNMLNRYSDRITGTSNMKADEKLDRLFKILSGLEQEKKSTLYNTYENAITPISFAVNAVLKGALLPVKVLIDSPLIQKSKYKAVRELGNIAKKAHKSKYEIYFEHLDKIIGQFKTDKYTWLEGTMDELRGNTDANNYAQKLGRRSNMVIDQQRKQIENNVMSHLVEMFDDITRDEKIALTKAILKPDFQIFHERGVEGDGNFRPAKYNPKEIVKLFEKNSPFLQKEIDSLVNRIRKNYPAGKHWYSRMAINLGTWMATGNTTEDFTLLNAHNIATAHVTDLKVSKKDLPKITELIEELASLQAIKSTADVHKRAIVPVIEREFAKPEDQNGFLFALAMHKRLRERAKDEIFNGSPTQMIKGYTKEIFNPNITFIMAPASGKEDLKTLGFTQGDIVQKDDADPNEETLHMYVNKQGLTRSMMAGVMSYTSDRQKGATLLDIHAQLGHINPALAENLDLKDVERAKAKAIRNIVAGKATDKKTTDISLIPVIDENGNPGTYRYMMNEINRDTILEKDNDAFRILGSMEGAIIDKRESKIINDDMVQALYDDYQKNYKKHKDAGYFQIGPHVTNKRWREAYQMLPSHTRQTIRDVWGSDNMFVPRSIAPTIFGFRKLGFSGLHKTENPTKTPGMKMISEMLNDLFAFMLNRPIPVFMEQVWQESVKYIKNAIVIKSGAILAGNIISNAIILKVHGLSWREIVKYHAEALIHAKAYKRNAKEIDRLQRNLELIPSLKDKADVKRQIIMLEDENANNPVRELIEEGIHQTITEDIDLKEDNFSYRAKLLDKIEDNDFTRKLIGGIPKPIKKVGMELFMTDDSAWYQFMKDTTQMSDFASRYAMHKYNMKKGDMKYDDSIRQIVKFFVNYDLPTHEVTQYLNDMGVFMFSKFFFRIQAVMLNQAVEHPEKVLGLLLLQNLLGVDVEDIFDSVGTPQHLMNKVNFNMWELFENLWKAPLFTGAIHRAA